MLFKNMHIPIPAESINFPLKNPLNLLEITLKSPYTCLKVFR